MLYRIKQFYNNFIKFKLCDCHYKTVEEVDPGAEADFKGLYIGSTFLYFPFLFVYWAANFFFWFGRQSSRGDIYDQPKYRQFLTLCLSQEAKTEIINLCFQYSTLNDDTKLSKIHTALQNQRKALQKCIYENYENTVPPTALIILIFFIVPISLNFIYDGFFLTSKDIKALTKQHCRKYRRARCVKTVAVLLYTFIMLAGVLFMSFDIINRLLLNDMCKTVR